MQRLLCITGPTASGKTKLAIEVCKRIGGEIVSADSMQIYCGMDILSAKPTSLELAEVKHHLIGILPLTERCTASMYSELAVKEIKEIESRGKCPVLCGGTGLYVNALTKPLSFGCDVDEEYRSKLKKIAETEEGRISLYRQLQSMDPEKASKLHFNDSRRVIRAIEIIRETSETATSFETGDSVREALFDGRLYTIEWPREVLYDRINRRVDQMLQNGLIDEVRDLYKHHDEFPTASQAIGYKEIVSAFNGECSMSDAVERIKLASRHYAKRQMTWFRRDERVKRFDAESMTIPEMAERILADFIGGKFETTN